MLSSIKRINEYCFNCNDKIGNGCSSQVYLGLHQKTKQQVAIKIIPKIEHIKQENITIAENQIKFLQNFKGYPNIIQLHHASHTKNNIYIITELCQLGTLQDLLKTKGKLGEDQAKKYLQQIVNGYRFLAEKSVVHRDLKPMNIFVKKSEELVIGDFGFAIQLEKDKETFIGTAGSPYYMAPEVLFHSTHSRQSDIWALGMIYLEMLHGSIPWKSKRQTDLFLQIQNFDLSKYIPENITKQSKNFLKKALTKEIQNRMNMDQLLVFCEAKPYTSVNQEGKQQGVKQKKINSGHTLIKASSISTDCSDKSVSYEQNQLRVGNSKQTANKSHFRLQAKEVNIQTNHVEKLAEQAKPIYLESQSETSQKKISQNTSPVAFFHHATQIKKRERRQSINQLVQPQLKLMSQQILLQMQAQVNYFRFVFKLYKKMKEMIKVKDTSINAFKQHLLQLTYNILNETKESRHLSGIPEEKISQYRSSEQFKEATIILEQYKQRYQKQQQKDQPNCSFRGDKYFMKLLSHVLQILHQNVLLIEGSPNQLNRKKGLVFLIQDLMKLSEIFLLSKESDWKVFARKSQLKQKLDQVWPQVISFQYWQKVKLKFKKLGKSEHLSSPI